MPVRLLAVLLPLLAGCSSPAPASPPIRPDLIVKSVQVKGLRLAGDVLTFSLDVAVRNRGTPISSGKTFAVAAFVRPAEDSDDTDAVRVHFGAPPTQSGDTSEIALTLAGPMKPQTDKTLLATAWARVPDSWRTSPLEIVAIVDHCDAGKPCAILEQDETNNERAIQVPWP